MTPDYQRGVEAARKAVAGLQRECRQRDGRYSALQEALEAIDRTASRANPAPAPAAVADPGVATASMPVADEHGRYPWESLPMCDDATWRAFEAAASRTGNAPGSIPDKVGIAAVLARQAPPVDLAALREAVERVDNEEQRRRTWPALWHLHKVARALVDTTPPDAAGR